MYRLYSPKRRTDDGQGLAEYALILVLVAVATIVILVIMGPSTSDVYCEVVTILGGTCDDSGEGNEEEEVDVVTVFKAECSPKSGGIFDLHVDARSNGDCDPSVTLTSSPGTVMTCINHVYHHHYAVSICPSTVTVTSSGGGSATVSVTIKP